MSAMNSSTLSAGCTETDRLILTDQSFSQSGVKVFECFIDWGTPAPVYCNDTVFATLSPSCAVCTFSRITDSAVSCLSKCSSDFSSDMCNTCIQTFLSGWNDACIPQLRSSSVPSLEHLCASASLLEETDTIASQLSTCLAVNETRAIDCMTDNGFPNLPNDCGNCLFASQFITDSICHDLCTYRPFSGLCLNCINAYVANSVRSCFLLGSYSLIPTARCSSNDLALIGSSGSNVDTVLFQCKDSVSCMTGRSGFLIPGKGTVSNNCIQCLDVGETRSGFSCSQYSCGNITTDCAFSPSIGSSNSLCDIDDLAALHTDSPLMLSINHCLFTSSNRTMDTVISCLSSIDDTPLKRSLSTSCRSCMSGVLANMTSCVPTCDMYGNHATPCQDCVATSVSSSLTTCFGKATSGGVCSLTESTSIAFESWSLGILQRCLLENLFTNIPYCMNQAGLGEINALVDMSFDCQNCMSMYLLHDSVCPSLCRNNGTDSNECRLCVTDSITGMLQNCTMNLTLSDSTNITRDTSPLHPGVILPIIVLLISIL